MSERSVTSLYRPVEFVTHQGVTFGRATAAYNETTVNPFTKEETLHRYEGLPLFDGDPAHLMIYADLLMEEMGTEGLAQLMGGATAYGTYAGGTYEVPAGAYHGHDVGIRGETQWPVGIGIGQTWNRALVHLAGEKAGKELRGIQPISTISGARSSAIHTGLTDVRFLTLAGRSMRASGRMPSWSRRWQRPGRMR